MARMTHVTENGSPQMVDVSGKAKTARVAEAEGFLRLKQVHIDALGSLPKGDALATAKIAGIQAAKKCADLIPLCHPLPLTHITVDFKLEKQGILINSRAATKAETGVEMEAYTAVAIAGVTLIDMLKGVDPDMTLTDIRLLTKTGGKSNWTRPSES